MRNNKKYFILVVLCFFFRACINDENNISEGFTFRVTNRTDIIYKAEIVIGGFVNNTFIPTDSISFNRNLEIGGATLDSHFINDNRWKPQLNKIRNIPTNKAYFKLKLSNGRSEILKIFNTQSLFNVAIPEFTNIFDRRGEISILIEDNQISGGNNLN